MAHLFDKDAAEALFKWGLQNDSPPSDFKMRLMDSALQEIPAQNGYTAGGQVIGFDGLTSGTDWAQLQTSNEIFTPSAAPFPAYGDIRYAEVTDGTNMLVRFDLGSSIIITNDNKELRIDNGKIRLTKVTAAGAEFTINGLKGLLEWTFMQQNEPSTFYLALLTPDSVVGETLGACSEIPTGNGYVSGGTAVARSTAGFINLLKTWTPQHHTEIEISQKSYDTAGGAIPRYGTTQKVALTMDGSPVGDRKVICVFTADEAVVAPNGKMIIVIDGVMWINENETEV
jgi:hypothetical protein